MLSSVIFLSHARERLFKRSVARAHVTGISSSPALSIAEGSKKLRGKKQLAVRLTIARTHQ